VSVFRGLSQPLRLIVCAGQNAVKPSYTCRVTISCAKLHFFGKKSFPSHSRRSICQEKVGNYRMRCSRMQTLFSFIFVSSLVVYCDDHILLTYTIHYLVEIAGFI